MSNAIVWLCQLAAACHLLVNNSCKEMKNPLPDRTWDRPRCPWWPPSVASFSPSALGDKKRQLWCLLFPAASFICQVAAAANKNARSWIKALWRRSSTGWSWVIVLLLENGPTFNVSLPKKMVVGFKLELLGSKSPIQPSMLKPIRANFYLAWWSGWFRSNLSTLTSARRRSWWSARRRLWNQPDKNKRYFF